MKYRRSLENKQWRLLGLSMLGVLVLSACGGGGGGNGETAASGPQGTLTVSPSTLTFSSTNSNFTPLTQNVTATLSTNVSGTIYLRIVSDGPAVANIRDVVLTGSNSGQGTVVPAAPSILGPGRHTSTITVTACTSGPECSSGVIGTPQTIAVSYEVVGVRSSSTAVSLTLGLTNSPSDYTTTIPVVAFPSFTATSSRTWLTATPTTAGGNTGSVTLNLLQSSVDLFESGDHTATLTLRAPTNTPTGVTLEVPVTLTIAKPQLEQVTPYIAESNKSGTVTLRGLFLDRLPANSVDLSLIPTGDVTALTNVQIVSPTEIKATHPPLPPGGYMLRMRDAQGAAIDRSTARLVVVDPAGIGAGTLSYPSDGRTRVVRAMAYDAEDQSLFLAVSFANESLEATELLRWTHTPGGWTPMDSEKIPNLDQLAISANGQDLIVSTSPEVSTSYRPMISLRPLRSLMNRPRTQALDDHTYFSGLAVLSTNDVIAFGDSRTLSGSGWASYRYSIKRNVLTPLRYTNELAFRGFVGPVVAVSGDGQRVVAGDVYDNVFEYAASSSSPDMVRAPVRFEARAMSMDRTGDTLLVRAQSDGAGEEFLRVYDRNWNVRGAVPWSQSIDYLVSPDGARIYTYDHDNTVRVYDLASPTVGGMFPEMHTLTLTDLPDDSFNLRMIITPDNRTLFIAGRTQVIVFPVP